MPYAPLRLSEDCPVELREFIRETIELSLRDVHAMLRLPQRTDGLEAGCNFSIASVLMNVISGASTVLYDSRGPSGKRFITCLRDYYPWTLEHEYRVYKECVKPAAASGLIYELYRNPFTHALGLSTLTKKAGNKNVRVIRRRDASHAGIGRIVQIGTGLGLTPQNLHELETGRYRPDWLPCTVESSERGYVLSSDALYCGVRRMVEGLSADAVRMEHAAKFLQIPAE